MRIYHGSHKVVEAPLCGLGKEANDYGRGFYCTEHPNLAAEWAVDDNTDGYINSYEFDTDGLRLLDLNSPQYCTLHWLCLHQQLERATRLGKLGQQVVLTSPKAFERVHFLKADDAPAAICYAKRQLRDVKARQEFGRQQKAISKHGLFIVDILRAEMRSDDERLR